MALPVFTTGQVLTASDVNAWFIPIASIRKPSDESVTSSATLQNDNDFTFTLAATAGYWLDGILLLDGGQTGDFKADWTGPAGTAVTLSWHGDSTGNTGVSNDTQQSYQDALSDLVTFGGFAVGGGTVRPIIIHGTIRTTGTSGTLQLRWAQNTSNSTATIVKAKSQITLRRIE